MNQELTPEMIRRIVREELIRFYEQYMKPGWLRNWEAKFKSQDVEYASGQRSSSTPAQLGVPPPQER